MAHYISDTAGPVSVGTGHDPNTMFSSAFGPPSEPIKLDPYAKHRSHMHALPKAYEGRNLYLGEVMEQKMADTPNFWLDILPQVVTDEIEASWSKISYDRHVANHQPEESVSRVLTSEETSYRRSFSRRGLALEMEHGFFKTEMGMRRYREKVVQIIYSLLNTMNYDIYLELLSCAENQIAWNRKYGYFGARDLVEIMEREKFRWGIAQKEKNGMEKLQAEIRDEMRMYGGEADTWILDPRIMPHLNLNRDEKSDYNLAGPAGPARVNNFGNIPVAAIANSRVFLAEQNVEEAVAKAGMMIRERQIGGYMIMDNKHLHNTDEEYRSYHRSIQVFDEDIDGYRVLTLQDAIANCHLFDEEGELYTPPDDPGNSDYHQQLGQDFLRFPLAHSNARSYHGSDSEWMNVQIFGQIRKQFMSTSILRKVASTLAHGVYEVEGGAAGVNSGLKAGMRVLTRRRNLDLTKEALRGVLVEDQDDNLEVLPATDGNLQRPQQIVWKKDAFGDGIGRISWSSLAARAAAPNGEPALKKFKEIVESIVDHAQRVLPQSLGVDARYSSSGADMNSAYEAFVDNLIGMTGFTVWMKPGIRAQMAEDAAVAPIADIMNDNRLVREAVRASIAAIAGNAAAGVREKLNALFGNDGKAKPIAAASGPEYVVWRTSLAGLLQHLKYAAPNNFNEISEFVDFANAVDTGKGEDISRFFTDLKKKSQWFATPKRDMTKILTSIDTDLANALAKGNNVNAEDRSFMNISDATLGQAAQNTFYRTPLRITGRQLQQLMTIRKRALANANANADAWATSVTISRPGTMDTMPADTATLQAVADRVGRAMAGESRFSSDVMEVFPRVQINRFERTHMSRIMRAPLDVHERDQYDMGRGRGEALDVDDDAWHSGTDLADYGEMAAGVTGYHVTSDFLDAWKQVDHIIGRDAERMMARLFLLTPVNYASVMNMIENDVDTSFFKWLVFRPHQRYNASLGMYVGSGGRAGHMYTGHLDVMLSDDAQHKTHFGHITTYMKAIVKDPEHVYIAYDIFIVGRLGGAGTKPYKVHEYYPLDGKYGDGSLFYVVIPGTERDIPNPLDASGNFSQFMLPGNFDQDKLYETHYSTFARYSAIWGWQNGKEQALETVTPLYHHHIGLYERWGWRYNTVMWKDLTLYYNPKSGKHDIREENTGHWGPICFPGCNKIRSGSNSHWDQRPMPIYQ